MVSARMIREPRPTTIDGTRMSPPPKLPPQPGSVWDRIEQARAALGWGERKMSSEALGNPTHYTKIWARGWQAKEIIVNKIIARLVGEHFSEAWLRAGIPPEHGSGEPLPTPKKLSGQLALLARRLAMQEKQLLALWTDLEGAGPLDKLSDEVQRAAFAAAYMEGRTLEDIRAAIGHVMRTKPGIRGIDTWLSEIRYAVRDIKPGSGTRPGLTLIPAKAE